MKKKIYCFDFDRTLTTSDTLLEFIRYAKGTGRFLMVFLMYSPLLVLMKLHLFPNWKAKQLIFAHLLPACVSRNLMRSAAICRRIPASVAPQRCHAGTRSPGCRCSGFHRECQHRQLGPPVL